MSAEIACVIPAPQSAGTSLEILQPQRSSDFHEFELTIVCSVIYSIIYLISSTAGADRVTAFGDRREKIGG